MLEYKEDGTVNVRLLQSASGQSCISELVSFIDALYGVYGADVVSVALPHVLGVGFAQDNSLEAVVGFLEDVQTAFLTAKSVGGKSEHWS